MPGNGQGDSPTRKVDQVRVLTYNGEEIGQGFNSDTGLPVGTALDFDLPTGDTSQDTFSDCTIVTTHEEVMDSIRMSFQADGRYGVVGAGSVKADFAKSTQFNSTSSFVVAKMVVGNLIRRGHNFRIRTGDDSPKALLDSGQTDKFKTAFGDSFVRGLYTGGEFYAVIRIT